MASELSFEVTYLGHIATLAHGETVLEALERKGVNVPSSCRAGACQSCLMRLVEGQVPASSQDGLKESLRRSGHFLACVCKPSQNICCEPGDSVHFKGETSILEIRDLGADVARVRLSRPSGFDFVPGQFVTLRKEEGMARSYSIASQASSPEWFDIHVRRVPGGKFSTWLHKVARPGDFLRLEGPKGDCMYYPGKPDEPLTLVGTGTGIAPLLAIAEDAMLQGHKGTISLYQGAISQEGLYLADEIDRFAARHNNVQYTRCVMRGPASEGVKTGDLKQLVVSELVDPKVRRVYLCGDPAIVRALKKNIFLAGVRLTNIHADPFV